MSWYKIAKHMNEESSRCGHCWGELKVVGITENTKHIYSIGQMYECPCGKSKVWANSIRNPEAFVKAVEAGNQDQYYQGFCYDHRCGYCQDIVIALKNNGGPRGETLWGCRKCRDNQNIMLDGSKEWGENVTPFLFPWYAQRIDQVKDLLY